MKRILLLIPISATMLLAGCMNNNPTPTTSNTGSQQTGDMMTGDATVSPGTNMTGANTSGTIISGGSMSGSTGQPAVRPAREYTINLTTAPSLTFELNPGDVIKIFVQSPTTKTAVRLNQIITPDGKADGPFQSDNTYTVTQKGKHTFIIGVNQMASEEVYRGDVKVTVSVNVK